MIPIRRLLGGASKLIAGTAFARGASLIAMPIVTRLYSPSDLGQFAAFAATVAVLSPLLMLRYPVALPLENDEDARNKLIALCMCISALLVALLLPIGMLVGDAVLGPAELGLGTYVALVLASAWVGAIYELQTFDLTRSKSFKAYGISISLKAVVEETSKIAAGVLFGTVGPLLCANPLSSLASSCYAARERRGKSAWWEVPLSRGILPLAWKYRHFPAFRLPSQILLLLAMKTPVLLFAYMYDSATAGHFALAAMIISVPFTLATLGISRSFYAEIACLNTEQRLHARKLLADLQKILGAVSVPLAVILYLTAPSLTSIIFGEQWALAGTLCQLMAPLLAMQILSSPSLEIFNITHNQRAYLLINVQRLLSVLATLALCSANKATIQQTVTIYTAVMCVNYAIVMWMARKELR